ncbi:phage tail tape measure protein [Spirosoma aureum]|uniref:Phage tail tape measure protein n=1 Tax=Spirosoma aureum TaxID=2692134 RepID=A0A6G9AWT8_9BACT|nr:phage tail tape measure protein [Spirosoma aureum]QIP16834.1 phage tail tape measure protein [Spirosoma aureum]
MGKSQTDRAVIDLVINGQQSKTSLKEIGLEATRARSALLKMREADDPAAYKAALAEHNKLKDSYRQMKARIDDTSTAWSRFKANTASTMAGIVGGNVVTTTLSAIVGSVGKAITSYREFNAASQELSAVTGATGKDLEYLNQQAARTGPSVGKSGAEMLEAYKLMASAKPELLAQKELLVQTTQAALTLAQAGKIDLAQATSVTAESLNQFGASADQANRFINVIAAGAKEGSAEIVDMGVALKNTGTVAAAQGVSFEQTNAVLQSLSTIALKGGEAGTQLRNVLLTLGAGSDDTNPRVVGLEKALENLGKKNLSTAEMTKLFGKENITAAQHIIAHRGEIAELTTKITGTQEAFSQAATNNKSLDHQLEIFWARVEGLAVSLGTSLIPAFTQVVEWATSLTNVLNSAVTPASDAAAMAFQDQKTKVMELNQSLTPLLTRHDQLTAKTILTKDEQTELKKIVGEVANIVPSAVTEFDKYGNALGINTEKAREFIRVQQSMLKVKNEEAIRTQTAALKDDENQLAENLAYRKKATTGAWDVIQATQDELRELDAANRKLSETIEGRKALLKDLRGENLKVPTITPTGTPKASTGGPDGKGGGKPSGPSEDEKKEAEKAKRLADEKKKANADAILATQNLKAKATKDDRERELAQAEFEAEQERKRLKESKAGATQKAAWMKAIEDKLLVDKSEIEEKYTKKQLEEQEKQLENLRKAAEEELELKKKIKLAEITMAVANGDMTKEEGEKAKLNAEQAFLEAKKILNEAHYQSLLDLYKDFTDKQTAIAESKKMDSDKLEGEITTNQADQVVARKAITQSEIDADKEKAKQEEQTAKNTHDTKKKIFNDSVVVIKEFFNENTAIYKAAMIAQQAWALGEVAINYSRAVMASIASASSIPFPGNILAIAKSLALPTLQAAAAVANIRSQKFDSPTFADGGFTGLQDMDGAPSGFIDGPTRFNLGRRSYIAGEAGREFVISNKSLRNPVVADFARIMDSAQKTGNYSQLAMSGGAPSAIPTATAAPASSNSDMSNQLLMQLIAEQQTTREVMKAFAQRPIMQNYRLREQFDDNIQEARDSNKL